MEFALGPEGQRITAQSGRTVPSLKEVAESDAFLDPAAKPANSRVFLDTIDVIRRVPNVSTWPEIEDAAEPIIEQGLYQGLTPEEAARKLTAVTAPMFARATSGRSSSPASRRRSARSKSCGDRPHGLEGELLVVLGPSGSGKSTTLENRLGLEIPTAGSVRIGGRDVTSVPAAKRNVAMVFQSYALFPHFDAAKNIGFGLGRGVKRDEVDRRVRAAAELVGVAELLHRRPHELRRTPGRRTARALAREPDVFLLDEPLSNLDAQLRTRTRAELRRLHGELGRTMVYVTHDQVEALTLGDRIAVLERGRVAQVGTPDDVYRRPVDRFVASFVGSPAMNFLPPETAERFALAHDGEVGVRPEHLRLGEGDVEGEVVLVEPAGSEAYVHLDVAGSRVVARVAPRTFRSPAAGFASASVRETSIASTPKGSASRDRAQVARAPPRALPLRARLARLHSCGRYLRARALRVRPDHVARVGRARELPRALGDDLFRRSLRNSLMFIAAAVPLRLLGALLFALLLHPKFRGVSAYRTGVYLPTVVPDVAFALLALWIFNPLYGPLNLVLDSIGAPTPQWLTDPHDARGRWC